MTKKRCLLCGETPGQADEAARYVMQLSMALCQAYAQVVRLQSDLHKANEAKIRARAEELIKKQLKAGARNGGSYH